MILIQLIMLMLGALDDGAQLQKTCRKQQIKKKKRCFYVFFLAPPTVLNTPVRTTTACALSLVAIEI